MRQYHEASRATIVSRRHRGTFRRHGDGRARYRPPFPGFLPHLSRCRLLPHPHGRHGGTARRHADPPADRATPAARGRHDLHSSCGTPRLYGGTAAATPRRDRRLDVVYGMTVPSMLASALFLGCANRMPRLWRFCFIYIMSALTCIVVSAFIPAIGAMINYATLQKILASLPPGAGRYHQQVFGLYHARSTDTIDVRHLQGVVTFPSFHAVMAFLAPFAAWESAALLAAACVWCAAVLLSAIPVGGHYAVDLIAGAAVFAVFAWLSRPRHLTEREPV
ncbi:hypothetical protein HLH34_09425 [Gluconacetobacter azotocaptans]|uniref:Inositolphosphotransferase Aur1/Ipt1 domain-containing protein n=2 Tax=Gluconacetobacter azotocaptans TaxID=142834 RepID=A0A7W4JSQ9_9PROT|nr:hypothetical protein [Gluconacetobacter azotocaptans]